MFWDSLINNQWLQKMNNNIIALLFLSSQLNVWSIYHKITTIPVKHYNFYSVIFSWHEEQVCSCFTHVPQVAKTPPACPALEILAGLVSHVKACKTVTFGLLQSVVNISWLWLFIWIPKHFQDGWFVTENPKCLCEIKSLTQSLNTAIYNRSLSSAHILADLSTGTEEAVSR